MGSKSGKSTQVGIKEATSGDECDPHSLFAFLKQLNRKGRFFAFATLRTLLAQSIRSNRYRGYCSIEKKMATLAKMFGLTEQEQEICYFLLITRHTSRPTTSSWTPAVPVPPREKASGGRTRHETRRDRQRTRRNAQRLDMVEMGRIFPAKRPLHRLLHQINGPGPSQEFLRDPRKEGYPARVSLRRAKARQNTFSGS